METIKIRASLVKAIRTDCFNSNYEPLVNKFLFWMCPVSGIFKQYYRIQGNEIYDGIEIEKALLQNSLYTVNSVSGSSFFCFKLILEEASEFDLFEFKYELKQNVIYYIKNNETVTGPYFINSENKTERILNGLLHGMIYIPSKKQTYEPIDNKIIVQ